LARAKLNALRTPLHDKSLSDLTAADHVRIESEMRVALEQLTERRDG
jgi:hypothetical protein